MRGVMELLERESELSAIDDAIEAVRHGVGRAVVVEGLAGIGKTGLLAAARDRAGAAGIQVLTARGSELEREYSYGIVRQLFEPVLARAGNAERRDILKGPATLAEQLVAEPPVGHPPSVAGEESRLHALFWLAVNVAERRHLALMVDDVQWSDAASLRWLGYLLRRMEGVPLLVVLALRPGEPGSEDAQLAALAAVPAAVVLRPAPLSRSAVRALVRATVSPGADDEFCAACHAATAGNPLLLHELLRALVVEGVTPSAHELKRVYSIGPHAVSRAVQLRLATLSPESSALARAVAVLGDNAELAHAAALTGLGDEAAAAAAATLVRVGLLRRELPLTFVHPVVRAAVYEVAPASERARAHAKAAEMLTQHQAPPERVAAHLLVAPPARRPAVVTTLRAAARLALGRGVADGAVAYLRRALAEPPAPEDRSDVVFELGIAEALIHAPSAIEHLREALASSTHPRRRGEAALELGRLLFFTKRGYEAVEIFDRALAELPEAEADLRQRIEAVFLHFAAYEPRFYPLARDRFDRLRAQPPDVSLGGRTLLAMLAFHDARAGAPAADCVRLAERALFGPRPDADKGLLLFGFCGFVLTIADRLGAAGQLFDEGIVDAQARGSVLAFASLSCLRANAAFRGGSLAAAEADARLALDAAESHGLEHARPYATAYLVDVLLERGDVEGAVEALDRVRLGPDVPDTAHLHFFLDSRARTRLRQGHTREGLADLRELGRRFDAVGGRNPAVLPWRSQAAHALVELGEHEEARRLAAEEVRLATAWGAPRALGNALRTAGIVAGGEHGLGMLRRAVGVLEQSPAALEHARALTDYGVALRRANDRPAAREQLRRAFELAHRCGATTLAERAHTELVAAGARPRRIATSGVESLTARERRIAEMAATGLTNREIAQALFVTPKTVEVHLHGSFQKLRIQSRSQLAGALVSGSGVDRRPEVCRPSRRIFLLRAARISLR